MNKIMKFSGIVTAVMLAGSVTMADPHGGRGDFRSRDYHGGDRYSQNRYFDTDRHGGYYHRDSHVGLVAGLVGLTVLAAVVAAANQPDTVYVQRDVVYSPPSPPPVVYVQQPARVVYQAAPVQVEYVRQQPTIVQQPVAYEPPQPVTVTINVQNSNGSMTPVALRQVGVQWVGPKGEYYDNLPSVGQLRPVYGF